MTVEERIAVDELTEAQAREELSRLAARIAAANLAYHTLDAPEISDAEYDALKRRNLDIESRFPQLKRADSPSEQVGAPLAEGFSKVAHSVRMMSLANERRAVAVAALSTWRSERGGDARRRGRG